MKNPRGVARIACVAGALVLVGLALPGPLHRYLFRTNLAEVIPGQVYRSAQPSEAALDRWADELGLQSVLSLRRGGGSALPGERRVAEQHSVEHYLVGMSTGGMPPPEALRGVVRVLDTAPRPLLLHCGAGIERSGLASALARLLDGDPLSSARAELSVWRGYSPLVSRSDFHRVLDDYEAWLDEAARPNTPDALREFIQQVYAPYYYRVRIEPLDPPGTVTVGDAPSLALQVTNLSRHIVPLRKPPRPGAVLAARIRALDREGGFALELRGAPLELDLAPGASAELSLALPRLSEPGRYEVMVDLVDSQRMKWLGDLGSQRTIIEIRAEPGSTRDERGVERAPR